MKQGKRCGLSLYYGGVYVAVGRYVFEVLHSEKGIRLAWSFWNQK